MLEPHPERREMKVRKKRMHIRSYIWTRHAHCRMGAYTVLLMEVRVNDIVLRSRLSTKTHKQVQKYIETWQCSSLLPLDTCPI